MKIYNTLSKRKEEFVPLEEGKVKKFTDSAIIIVEDTIKALQQIAE